MSDRAARLRELADGARQFSEKGRNAEARDAWFEYLSLSPGDRLALNNLGTLLSNMGYRTAARTAYAEAVLRHPLDPMSRVNLANLLHEKGDDAAAREHYEAALAADPDFAEAHQGLSYVLTELGAHAAADVHRRKAFQNRAVIPLPFRGEGHPISLLLLTSSFGGNIPTRNLLDDRVFATTVIVPEFHDGSPLPVHQLIFNAIGDADLADESLAAAEALVRRSNAPVLNSPSAVRCTTRAGNAARLHGFDGLVAPRTQTAPRDLVAPAWEPPYPVLLRTPGFHTGRHFVKVDRPEDFAAAKAVLPGELLTAIQYLDARGSDGRSRKYRVMMIDGELYPLHVAISSDWKIHYFTAEMAENGGHRAEDEAFLNRMPAVLGPRAMEALVEIQKILGLDYAGIDFGLNSSGQILFFEANATMVVNPPEPGEKWDYRRPAVDRIFTAVRQMLLRNVRT
jgi:glutathione synthase/RimK-type ligase-like ATP-grasp enzyme